MNVARMKPGERLEQALQRLGQNFHTCVACHNELCVLPTLTRGVIECPVCGVVQTVKFAAEQVSAYAGARAMVADMNASEYVMVRCDNGALGLHVREGEESFVGVSAPRDLTFKLDGRKVSEIRGLLGAIVGIIERKG